MTSCLDLFVTVLGHIFMDESFTAPVCVQTSFGQVYVLSL